MKEMLKFSRREKILKIDFTPSNEKEEKHLQRLKGLLVHKRNGDWKRMVLKMGISVPVL
ncbi:hypothetical protein GNY06_12580 [Elizabethkingia argentiflava]|uniref:Uncharacterized protein n=1 Tax=Elizabethkingia argenteiflava TaxID=2681556 RepID=A0A845PWF5_9FLAO|nr:hypothetical protein [Elizabethkingia argenteiflava]NAW52174.1 hypothetical protein [Elizabethkingia argenteiflava]